MEFGDLSGIVFNKQTGNLIGGHQRLKCLDPSWKITTNKEGYGFIETSSGKLVYREVDWSEKKEKMIFGGGLECFTGNM